MLCDKGVQLVKEAKRCEESGLLQLPFNSELVRLVCEEVSWLFEQNQRDVVAMETSSSSAGDGGASEDSQSAESGGERTVAVWVRHAAIQRNRRCLLAYLWQRARSVSALRWSFGAAVPADVRDNMCDSEWRWFGEYSRCLADYMGSLSVSGVDLASYKQPPRQLYVEVRVVSDYGEFETDDGDVVLLKKNSVHFLPRAQCENLIQLGVLQHVVH